MDITCWNCKTITKLDKAAVEAILTSMDASKLSFHDIACSSCGKSNRTARDLFVAGLAAFVVEPQLTKREVTQKAKEENATKEKAKKEKAKIKEVIKKAKK